MGRDGREIFYQDSSEPLMTVDVTVQGKELRVGAPRPLFVSAGFDGGFDVSADGPRFIVAAGSQGGRGPITLVHNWAASLKP